MKKLILLIAVFLTSLPVLAETMAVQAVTPISTNTPNKYIKVKVVRDCSLGNIPLKIGYILEGKMMSVIEPKRLKQDASFTFAPLKYYDLKGKKTHIAKLYVGEYSKNFEIDPAKVAKTAALSVGNHFIKGMSTGYYAVEGAVKNDEDNRAISAVHNVYENSLFSYVEKGGALNIEQYQCFGLKFEDCINVKE